MSTANALDDSLVMMKLGDYRFALSTAAYQAFDRDTAWRWPGVERIGGVTRPQFIGPGDDTIRLAGLVYPHFAGAGLGQIDAMRAEAAKGLPLRMVCGRGKFWGRWVVTSLTSPPMQRKHCNSGAVTFLTNTKSTASSATWRC